MVSSYEQKTPLTSSREYTSKAGSQKSHASRSRAPKRFLLTWYQELLACIGFVTVLIALFVTIYQYQDKPSPDWPEWLSINSIIAIYLVLLKSCVLLVTAEGLGQLKWSWFASEPRSLHDISRYDGTMRGPWGAARLIWRLKFRQLLASLGALVTLLTLLVDAASQQIVHFYGCEVGVSEAQASVSRTAMWAANGNRIGSMQQSMDPEVKRAIEAGVSGTFASPGADCGTLSLLQMANVKRCIDEFGSDRKLCMDKRVLFTRLVRLL